MSDVTRYAFNVFFPPHFFVLVDRAHIIHFFTIPFSFFLVFLFLPSTYYTLVCTTVCQPLLFRSNFKFDFFLKYLVEYCQVWMVSLVRGLKFFFSSLRNVIVLVNDRNQSVQYNGMCAICINRFFKFCSVNFILRCPFAFAVDILNLAKLFLQVCRITSFHDQTAVTPTLKSVSS